MTVVLRLSLLSGFLGATASCLAKFALDPKSPVVTVGIWLASQICQRLSDGDDGGSSAISTWLDQDAFGRIDWTNTGEVCMLVVSWIPRVLCLVVMILMNVVMVGYFLKGMEESGSVAGTGLATASNFVASALYGILLWNEEVSFQWLVGFSFVVGGVGLLSTVQAT